MKNDFTYARRKLVTLYLCIIGSVIALFSFLVAYQAHDSFSDPAILTDAEIQVSAEKALKIAKEMEGKKEVSETEYEIENGKLYFTTIFEDDSEVKVDLFSGDAYIPNEEGFLNTLTDDFDEMVGWIALLVFLLASLLCVYVANRTLEPIAQSIRKQKQFVSDAAHELRNPLAALHARIESTLHRGVSKEERAVFEDLLGETKHLVTLTEGLLSLEKNEYGVGKAEAVSVPMVIKTVVGRLEFFARTKHITIAVDCDSEPLVIGRSDLEIIVYNLLHNALKFSNEGNVVTVTWKNKTLSVVDRGVGIDAEKVPYIFDRFYKVDMARTEEGSGLGLALVKEIATKHAAIIDVTSAPGEGTTMSVRF